MATVLRSGLAPILLSIQNRIVAVTTWDLSRVIIDTEGEEMKDEENYQAEQLVFIKKGSESPVPGFVGMGRVWSPRSARINCVLWTRTGLDEVPGFAIGMTDPILGHEIAALGIASAMEAWQPADGSGNWLVQEPIEPASIGSTLRRKNFDKTWAKTIIGFNVTYAPSVDQTYQ